MQHGDEEHAEYDRFELHIFAEQDRHDALHCILEQRDETRSDQSAPDMAGAAKRSHQ
jgi:hypothetical protein